MQTRVQIIVQYFETCPHAGLARERLAAALETAGLDQRVVRFVTVGSPEDAEQLGFRGSPTFLIDGLDPFADASAPAGFACRIYETEAGPEGAPSVAQLAAALGS